MIQGSLRFARVLGIQVRVHPSWLVAFALVTWTLAANFFPAYYPGWDGPTYWVTAGLGAVLLFGSVLIHELAHSVLAQRRGLKVHSITLFVFGGVSAIHDDGEDAGDEFVIAIVGPLTSLALAGSFWGLALLWGRALTPMDGLLSYLAFINIGLAVFNLVPGFPLDGGRVVRSILWGTTGDYLRATKIASGLGQVVALLLVIWGVQRLLSGDIMGGVWIAVVGWFLNNAAESARREIMARAALRGMRMRDLMAAVPAELLDDFQRVPADAEAAEALRLVHEHRLPGLAVIDERRVVVGVVTLDQLEEQLDRPARR